MFLLQKVKEKIWKKHETWWNFGTQLKKIKYLNYKHRWRMLGKWHSVHSSLADSKKNILQVNTSTAFLYLTKMSEIHTGANTASSINIADKIG